MVAANPTIVTGRWCFALPSRRQPGKPLACHADGYRIPLPFPSEVVNQQTGRCLRYPFEEKMQRRTGNVIRKLDLDQLLDLALSAQGKVDLSAVFGPYIVEIYLFPGGILEILDMLQEAYGTGILEPDAFVRLDEAAIVKIDLRLPQNRPRHIGMKGTNGKNDAQVFQNIDITANGIWGKSGGRLQATCMKSAILPVPAAVPIGGAWSGFPGPGRIQRYPPGSDPYSTDSAIAPPPSPRPDRKGSGKAAQAVQQGQGFEGRQRILKFLDRKGIAGGNGNSGRPGIHPTGGMYPAGNCR